MPILLYAVFVLSGAAGLIYETIWSRYLGLFVGHSAYAQVIVLVIFLGGMSLGALAVGERSERLRQPLLAYAAVEALTGVIGLFFHDLFGWATTLAYDSLFPALPNEPTVVVVKWTLAALLILPQSILLGMTFPLMSAGVLRIVRTRPGQVLSLLYFANSLGAAGGALLAGFALVAWVGLPGTLLTAAMINLAVALATFLAVRGVRPKQAVEDASAMEQARQGALVPLREPLLWRVLLVVSFGTAVASFIYEIAWIRMLSLVLGSATHSFELMLSAFILGLALGALWAQRRADRFGQPLRALGIVQLCMGLAAMATLPVYLRSYHWTASLLGALARSDAGYAWFGIGRYGLCLAVMLPATFCAGITLPVITRTLIAAGRGERAIGAVYGVNTIGSIVGAALASLVLLPLTGVKNLLVLGAVVDMALGVLLLRAGAVSPRAARVAWGAAAAVVMAALLSSTLNRFDADLLASGVYRYAQLPKAGSRELLYYADGRTASVAVIRQRDTRRLVILTNGKPDASLDTSWLRPRPGARPEPMTGDIGTQSLLPLLTLAHAPGARDAAVIGQGSGMTSHMLLASPALRQVVTIEIEPAMIAGSRLFYPANRRVFDDRRSRFVLDDAKSYFAASNRRFDIIISEPSNPWVSGVSGLFTTEFYQRVRRYLTPTGVFGQWLHLYEIDDGLVLSVLSALHRNFRAYDVYMTSPTDILIVATNAPAVPAPDWRVFQWPEVRQDLRVVIPFRVATLNALHLAGRAELEPVIRRYGSANSDYYPILDLSTERTRFLISVATGFALLRGGRFDVVGALAGERTAFGDTAVTTTPGVVRPLRLAIGAALRLGLQPDSSLGTEPLRARHRRWQLEAGLTADREPDDWRAWVGDFATAESDEHAGTAGVVDEAFYGRANAFLARQRAPAGARAAVSFLHGLAAWDFAEAARAADVLVADSASPVWLPVDDLRDGAAVARLRLGDGPGALRIWRALARRSGRPATDLRSLFIEAHIEDAVDRARGATPQTASR